MTRHNNEDEFVDLQVRIYAVTAKAILVAPEGAGEDAAAWVPRSQCRFSASPQRETDALVSIKEWIAKREGLIND